MGRRLAVCAIALYAGLLVIVTTSRAALVVFTSASHEHERKIGYGQIRFDGAGPERWAQRWRVQHRQVLALRRALAQRLDRVIWLVDAFQCIHSYEGAWSSNTGNGYWGGLQFGSREWQRFGGQFATRADLASPSQQIAAGISYYAVSGFAPWPNTARMCGLR
jgi:hypothetical protein